MFQSRNGAWNMRIILALAALCLGVMPALAGADRDAEREYLARLAHELAALMPLLETAERHADPDARIRFPLRLAAPGSGAGGAGDPGAPAGAPRGAAPGRAAARGLPPVNAAQQSAFTQASAVTPGTLLLTIARSRPCCT
jgi:hypothetical protein